MFKNTTLIDTQVVTYPFKETNFRQQIVTSLRSQAFLTEVELPTSLCSQLLPTNSNSPPLPISKRETHVTEPHLHLLVSHPLHQHHQQSCHLLTGGHTSWRPHHLKDLLHMARAESGEVKLGGREDNMFWRAVMALVCTSCHLQNQW